MYNKNIILREDGIPAAGRKPENEMTVSMHNLGCKVNSYEAEAALSLLENAGYRIVPFTEKADVVIINTCTVTAVADKKSRQMIHRAKTLNPEAVVVAMGCYAETGREKLEEDAGVDIIVGNNRKKEIVSILNTWFEDHDQNTWYDEISKKGARYEEWNNTMRTFEMVHNTMGTFEMVHNTMGTFEMVQKDTKGNVPVVQKDTKVNVPVVQKDTKVNVPVVQDDVAAVSHTRAFVKIQDGCDRFCSYCIIPYARGRIRSRQSGEVLEEIRRLADEGVLEVVLTGIHVSSYGRDQNADCSLISLIEKIHETDGIRRIRLSSLEPGIIDEDFASRLAALNKVCPHFHLSLQSGCDATLKRMNRSYTSGEYAEKCRILREHFDRPALTTDVIAGFPGETEEEFEQSYAFIKEIGFFETHIFPYSRRKGTAADRMPDQIPEAVKKERVRRLLELNEVQSKAFLEQFEGEQKEVLFEETEEQDGILYWTGHTARYEKVYFQSGENLRNRILIVP